jgi:hypothetical protein
MMRNDGMPALSADTRPCRTPRPAVADLLHQVKVPGLTAVTADLRVDGIPPGCHYGG